MISDKVAAHFQIFGGCVPDRISSGPERCHFRNVDCEFRQMVITIDCEPGGSTPVETTVHHPDQYMSELRTIVAQGKKRIGFLIGAGAPAGIRNVETSAPLIPAIAQLTDIVVEQVPEEYRAVVKAARTRQPSANIEVLLSSFRALSRAIGESKVEGLCGKEYAKLSDLICKEIGKIVDVRLPEGETPYGHLVNWIVGTSRRQAIEVFTTNYDLLLEEALERARAPFFDGFSGSRVPFFDPVTIANDDLPSRITRLWKLHGSLGWSSGPTEETVRTGSTDATSMIYPEHLKYDQTQKAPYVALFDRLQTFLRTDDALLIGIGFSFADAHVSAKIDEALAANPSAAVFAFQFRTLEEEEPARRLGLRRSNFSVYASDKAVVNGIEAPWRPGELPSRDWGPIRASYWGKEGGAEHQQFRLGDFMEFARFLAFSKSASFARLEAGATNEAEEVS